MPINIIAVLVAALVPMALGFIWYNPKTPMGATWMRETGMTEEKMKGSNMAVIFGLSLLFSFFLSWSVGNVVIHQMGIFSIFQHEELKASTDAMNELMNNYGGYFRTVKHGLIHGFFMGLTIVLPVMATNAMFERKSWKLTWVNVGYWTICLMIMGAIICAWQ